ncbi:MAG: SDR family oxidoreductase [Desulfurococcaceae archaeon]
MIRTGFGRMIKASSVAGAVVGFPALINYSASKVAVAWFKRALMLGVVRFNVTVNAVAPGPIETPGLCRGLGSRARRYTGGQCPWEGSAGPRGASLLVFLALDEADFVTGQLLVVDGATRRSGAGPFCPATQDLGPKRVAAFLPGPLHWQRGEGGAELQVLRRPSRACLPGGDARGEE